MISKIYDRFFIKKPHLRRAVTKFIYGDRDRTVRLLGADITINSLRENGYLRAHNAAASRSLFGDEIAVMLNLNALLWGSVRFLDVGANIGIFSSVVARLARVNPELGVTAFEVDPDTFARLSRNAEVNGFEVINIGVSDTCCETEFVRGAVSHVTSVTSAINPYAIRNETFKASVRRLDSFEVQERELVVKIDVEGHELEALRGLHGFLEEGRVRAIYFDGVADVAGALKILKTYDFRLLNGRTLQEYEGAEFSLLAVKK